MARERITSLRSSMEFTRYLTPDQRPTSSPSLSLLLQPTGDQTLSKEPSEDRAETLTLVSANDQQQNYHRTYSSDNGKDQEHVMETVTTTIEIETGSDRDHSQQGQEEEMDPTEPGDYDHHPMGTFLSQVSTISASLHLIQSDIESSSSASSVSINRLLEKDPERRRSILNCLTVQLSKLNELNRSLNRITQTTLSSERSIRTEQLLGLKFRIIGLLNRLKSLATQEREELHQEVEAHFRILETGQSVDGFVGLQPFEASKRLTMAVRSSVNYPEARQAALATESDLEKLRRIDEEIQTSDEMAKQLIEEIADEEEELTCTPLLKGEKFLESSLRAPSNRKYEGSEIDIEIGGNQKPSWRRKCSRLSCIMTFLAIALLVAGGIVLAVVIMNQRVKSKKAPTTL